MAFTRPCSLGVSWNIFRELHKKFLLLPSVPMNRPPRLNADLFWIWLCGRSPADCVIRIFIEVRSIAIYHVQLGVRGQFKTAKLLAATGVQAMIVGLRGNLWSYILCDCWVLYTLFCYMSAVCDLVFKLDMHRPIVSATVRTEEQFGLSVF